MTQFLVKKTMAPAHRSRHTVAYLASHVTEFIEPENWPPNSLDVSLVDYSVWGALQQTVYRQKIRDTDQLKCVLLDCWDKLSPDTEKLIGCQKDLIW